MSCLHQRRRDGPSVYPHEQRNRRELGPKQKRPLLSGRLLQA